MVYSVGFAQVALARHSKSKLFLYTRLLATFSVLCILFLLLTPSHCPLLMRSSICLCLLSIF